MSITLRSHLIAGTAAVVGAGAIAMTPVTAAHLNLPSVQVPSAAQVALAGFDSPLTELLLTVGQGATYLFDSFGDPTDPASWPFSGIAYGTTPLAAFIWPAALAAPEAGGYSSVGLIPQLIDDALPVISQLGYNWSDYTQALTTGITGAGAILGEAAWNAAGDLLKLQIPAALQELKNGLISSAQLLTTAGAYVFVNVVNRGANVIKYLINDIPTLVGATFRQVQVAINALVIKPIKDVFAALQGPNKVEGVWNAVVDNVFGMSGIPGTALNLTIGAGVQTGPVTGATVPAVEASIAQNFVPSVRTEVQAALKGIQGELAKTPTSAAAVKPSRAAARAAAAVEAPSAAAVTSDAPDSSAPAAASDGNSKGKHRVARSAAARHAR